MAAQANVVEATNVVSIQHAAAVDRMGGELLKALVDEVRNAPAQWSKLTEMQQSNLITRLRQAVYSETEKAVILLAKGEHKAATVRIESLTVKEGAKVVLQASEGAARDALGYVGLSGVLVMCNPQQFFAGGDDVKGDKDQTELPLDGAAPTADGDRLTINVDDPIGSVEDEEAEEAAAAAEPPKKPKKPKRTKASSSDPMVGGA